MISSLRHLYCQSSVVYCWGLVLFYFNSSDFLFTLYRVYKVTFISVHHDLKVSPPKSCCFHSQQYFSHIYVRTPRYTSDLRRFDQWWGVLAIDRLGSLKFPAKHTHRTILFWNNCKRLDFKLMTYGCFLGWDGTVNVSTYVLTCGVWFCRCPCWGRGPPLYKLEPSIYKYVTH